VSGFPPHLAVVLAGGAVGGIASWLYSMTWGFSLPVASRLVAFVACTVLGVIAAMGGVYLRHKSDVRNLPRLAAMALLLGLFWKPVLDASLALVAQRSEIRAEGNKSEGAADAVASGNLSAVDSVIEFKEESAKVLHGEGVKKARDDASKVLSALSKVAPGPEREAARSRIEKAFPEIKGSGGSAP
jgi:hypothetical protein